MYLPLYNGIKWMEVAVPAESEFIPLQVRNDKPVVVYGTSIAQGGCATRPGLAWTNILSRKLDRPVINLGFSGNGRLEKEVLDLVAATAAKIYVLDCLPNLVGVYVVNGELKKRLVFKTNPACSLPAVPANITAPPPSIFFLLFPARMLK